jgi:hypothetical protein
MQLSERQPGATRSNPVKCTTPASGFINLALNGEQQLTDAGKAAGSADVSINVRLGFCSEAGQSCITVPRITAELKTTITRRPRPFSVRVRDASLDYVSITFTAVTQHQVPSGCAARVSWHDLTTFNPSNNSATVVQRGQAIANHHRCRPRNCRRLTHCLHYLQSNASVVCECLPCKIILPRILCILIGSQIRL